MTNSRPLALIVDDDELLAELMSLLLEDLGFDTVVHTSPLLALDWLSDHEAPALLITDVQMPKMDGIRLSGEARMVWPLLPIIFISGYCDAFFGKEVSLPKCSQFLVKPFSQEDMARVIGTLLGE